MFNFSAYSFFMIVLLQRVSESSVSVDGKSVGKIDRGLTVLLGVQKGDTEKDARFLAEKVATLRVFPNGEKEFDLSVIDTKGSCLVVSQFTLAGNCLDGRRPSFDEAAPADEAKKLYEFFVTCLREIGVRVETGVFQAHMMVDIRNDGPVTFIINSKK